MFRNQFVPNGTTWRDQLKGLQEAKNEYAKYSNIMTQFEQAAIQKTINDAQDKVEPAIINGAFAEFEQTVQKAQSIHAKIQKAKVNEINRWDAGKLASEMQVIEMLAKQVVKSPSMIPAETISRLKNIYAEAQQSGNMYKQRAAAEVFTGLLSIVGGNDLEQRIPADGLAQQAKRDAAKLRITPEMETAEREGNEAIQEVEKAKFMLEDVNRQLGYRANYEFKEELSRLQQEPSGKVVLVDREKLYQAAA
jgi:hypothetical protein